MECGTPEHMYVRLTGAGGIVLYMVSEPNVYSVHIHARRLCARTRRRAQAHASAHAGTHSQARARA